MQTVRLKCDQLGSTTQEVELVKETPMRYRIRAISRTFVWSYGGCSRWLNAGETTLVAKGRILRDEPPREPSTREIRRPLPRRA